MLHEFLSANRGPLIELCRQKVDQRRGLPAPRAELHFGVPLFLDQLIQTLKGEPTQHLAAGVESTRTATLHGRELLQHGFSVEQVVRDYGDLCQAITTLATQTGTPIQSEEFRILNRCLDNGIADAVVEFTEQHELLSVDREVQVLNQRLGVLAHDMRVCLNSAMLAVSVIRTGQVGMTGATGAVLDRSLTKLRALVDRTIADVRVNAGTPVRRQHVPVDALVADIRISASLEANLRQCEFLVEVDGEGLGLSADRHMLLSALGILLQNAFKFTHAHSRVTLRFHAVDDRILIDVQDHCGGLPPGNPQDLLAPATQLGPGKTGMGFGLPICRRTVEAIGGTLSVRNLPGSGCVFTIDMPRDFAPVQ
ncbi:MAG: HAMP domain-containing histidine kinase [Pseudomonadota bacterium]|nr:HAMP domain-containing histidine kinase [Pseudomonadota bacterium]